jgi:ankyrin repeat protein
MSLLGCGNAFNGRAFEINRSSPVPSNSAGVVPRCKPIQYDSPADDKTCYELQEKLITSAKSGDLDGIREALKKGANVEAGYGGGFKALYAASMMGQKDAVSLLLDFGANPNKIRTLDGTPLYTATYYGHKETVQVLLEKGADVCLAEKNDSGKMDRPLDVARRRSFPEIEEILIKAGAGRCSD